MRWWTFLLCVFVCSFAIQPSAYADDPELDYFTLETPNFLVHFDQNTEQFAILAATAAEEAHAILSPLLDWVPSEKTHIVLDDTTDVANGSATVFGRSLIRLLVSPPEADSALGFYDDWLRVLVYHEYVHILHLDTVGGIPTWLNRLIGKQWSPNQTMPRWYTEGLATYHEARRTRGGRVEASLFQMYLRTSALDDSLYDLGAATNLPVKWPSGSVAYLYGSSFLDYVFRKHGEEYAPKFNKIYGRKIIPWSLNNISRAISGETMNAMWKQWNAELKGRADAHRLRVHAEGETKLEYITNRGVDNGPLRRRGDAITYFQQDHRTSPAIFGVDSKTLKTDQIYRLDTSSPGYEWTPDGETLIITQPTVLKNNYRYRDIYFWNSKRDQQYRITKGERAREPAISPDGKTLAYVRNRRGTMELVVRKFDHMSGQERVLVSGYEFADDDPAHWQQIATPTFSPDGSKIVFGWWRMDKMQRDLWMVDVATKEKTQLTNDFAMELDPFWNDDGKIYFSGDRTGVYNIYTLDPATKSVRKISNVMNGVFSPVVSKDQKQIYVRSYQSHGFDVARFAMPEGDGVESTRSVKENARIIYPEVDTSKFKKTDYQATKYLAPVFFDPQFGVFVAGTGFGGTLTGFDPIRHHSYGLTVGYTTGKELEDRGTSIALNYGYNGLPVGLSFSGLFRDRPRNRDLFAGSEFVPYFQRQYIARLGTTFPFRTISDSLSLSLAFNLNYSAFAELPIVDQEPGDLEPRPAELGWRNGISFTLAYSNSEAYPLSVSAQTGWRGSISLSLRRPEFGSDFTSTTFNYRFDRFFSNPFWTRHSLNLRLDGAFAISDARSAPGYSLGGNSPQDLFSAVLFQEQRVRFVLRGHEPAAVRGNQFFVTGADYRFPIWDFESGFSTLPIFFRQLKGSVYFEAGSAYDGFLADADLLSSVGVELLLNTQTGYYLFGNLRLGYSRGLDSLGINEFYALYGGGF